MTLYKNVTLALSLTALIDTKCEARTRNLAREIDYKHTYNTCDDKLQGTCHLPAPGRKCMIHLHALKDFPDASQVSLYKNNKTHLLHGIIRGAEN
jgi:hypothetical protein